MNELFKAGSQDEGEVRRNEAIDMYLQGLKVSDICRAVGRSRGWFYQTLKRYQQEGRAGLRSKSRAPHRVHNRTDRAVEATIIRLRQTITEGQDPAKAEHWRASLSGLSDSFCIYSSWLPRLPSRRLPPLPTRLGLRQTNSRLSGPFTRSIRLPKPIEPPTIEVSPGIFRNLVRRGPTTRLAPLAQVCSMSYSPEV